MTDHNADKKITLIKINNGFVTNLSHKCEADVVVVVNVLIINQMYIQHST